MAPPWSSPPDIPGDTGNTLALYPAAMEFDNTKTRGMTLIEIVATFSIVALLAGLVMPLIQPRLEGARIDRATRDVESIAQSLRTFWKTTGVWPCRDGSGDPDGLHVLCSGPRIPVSNPWTSSNAWWTRLQSGPSDVLDHHLYSNTPGGSAAQRYPTSGLLAWRGPYTDTVPLDPWDRPYVVLVAAGRASPSVGDPIKLFVLSAGPDGHMATSIAGASSTSILGDDIGVVAWRRS